MKTPILLLLALTVLCACKAQKPTFNGTLLSGKLVIDSSLYRAMTAPSMIFVPETVYTDQWGTITANKGRTLDSIGKHLTAVYSLTPHWQIAPGVRWVSFRYPMYAQNSKEAFWIDMPDSAGNYAIHLKQSHLRFKNDSTIIYNPTDEGGKWGCPVNRPDGRIWRVFDILVDADKIVDSLGAWVPLGVKDCHGWHTSNVDSLLTRMLNILKSDGRELVYASNKVDSLQRIIDHLRSGPSTSGHITFGNGTKKHVNKRMVFTKTSTLYIDGKTRQTYIYDPKTKKFILKKAKP